MLVRDLDIFCALLPRLIHCLCRILMANLRDRLLHPQDHLREFLQGAWESIVVRNEAFQQLNAPISSREIDCLL
ncbi:hypothetical protein AXXA_29690 [Achromobacter insuavis AXX-A]|uniref:Uncharacterized protein n=1 Tax=Achromobacter insuavis AXX-A TaxID=1003200 RepID=F7TAD8_9BURK|nr:hypothetical protein AXXA_29690 [Achromobacter insuavis AXX-A]